MALLPAHRGSRAREQPRQPAAHSSPTSSPPPSPSPPSPPRVPPRERIVTRDDARQHRTVEPPASAPTYLDEDPPTVFADPSRSNGFDTIDLTDVVSPREAADETSNLQNVSWGPDGSTPQPGSLSVRNLSAWFGTHKVLERCNLEIRAGRVMAIIGPSGCGKSVFLRNLNRMHEVIRTARMGGFIELDGEDIHGGRMSPTDVRLKIGMVFQRPNPFPSMSIRENVLAGLKLAGKKTKDPDGLVEWALQRAGLWREVKDRLNQGGAVLSGGQQQRLCIARSLALRPKVLLMDEPCSALDPISTRVIEETIQAIGHEITIVIVTHNMQQAARVADDCAFFLIEDIGKPGKVVEAGPTDQIFNHPRDSRTGDYVSGRFG